MNHFVVLTFLLNTTSGKNFLVELSDNKSSSSSSELESEFESETAFEEVKKKVETSKTFKINKNPILDRSERGK